jgi:2-keto-4-pentenoate hydratase/2-oxohepta-3-ene-1,7-dioic acid hydratase in catechol pathway
MKIVRFAAGGRVRYGEIEKNIVRVIAGNPFRSMRPAVETFPLEEVRLLPPCKPSKVVAVGVNYRSHAREMGSQLPKNPLIFLKPPTSIVGPEDNIVYPRSSQQVDYEGELGVVIGRTARNVPKEKARDFILGYTCLNDVTARDLQRSDGQWTRSKGFNTFCPIGPSIETELDDTAAAIETYLNGRLVQEGSTADLVFGVPELVSFASEIMTLLPGDIIATGTPGGIGPMQVGDTVEVKIEAIGTLRNYVVE